MTVEIVPACLRDVSYVLYNLNPDDEAETACQIDPAIPRSHLAYALLMSGDNFAARIDDQPVAVFGTSPLNRCTQSVWALGTSRMRKVLPAISRYMIDEHLPRLVADGYRYMEARSIETHVAAHRWLRWLGGQQHGGAFEFGRDGENFFLFRWTIDDFERIRAARRRAP